MAINLIGHFAISILGILLFFSTPGYSIHCWACTSKFDPRCADPFDNSSVHSSECALVIPPRPLNPEVKLTACAKIVQKLNNTIVISRDCAPQGEDDGKCSASLLSAYRNVEYCSTCSATDNCNSAPVLSRITSAALVPVIIFLTKINTSI